MFKLKKENRDTLIGLLVFICIIWFGNSLIQHQKQNKIEAEKASFERQIQNIDFSNVDNASKDIDKILKPKVINYMSSDVTLYEGKYIVDVYVKLNGEKYYLKGSEELSEKFPITLATLFKNDKIDSVCVWGNAKTNFKHKMIEGNFVSATFDRKTYHSIKDFKKLSNTRNGRSMIEDIATSYTLDERYELDYN